MRSAPSPARFADPWPANRDRADAGHDLAFRQMTVAHQPLAAFIGALLGVAPEERGHLGLDRLGQKGTGAVAQHLGQRIGTRSMAGKASKSYCRSRRITPLLEKWRLNHPHDTPP